MCRVLAVGVLALVCGCGVAQDAPPGAKPKAERPKAEQPAEKPAKEKTDYERWQGTWESGNPKSVVVIRGISVRIDKGPRLRLRLDPDARPRTFDYVIDEPDHPRRGEPALVGIYQIINDDTIEIGAGDFHFIRPMTFGDAARTEIMRRVK